MDIRVLCLYQCIEGATCGPGSFTFRFGPDVIRTADLPEMSCGARGDARDSRGIGASWPRMCSMRGWRQTTGTSK
jgi:hypothetical protein